MLLLNATVQELNQLQTQDKTSQQFRRLQTRHHSHSSICGPRLGPAKQQHPGLPHSPMFKGAKLDELLDKARWDGIVTQDLSPYPNSWQLKTTLTLIYVDS